MSPLSPLSPFSPLGPIGPISPVSPLSPLSPLGNTRFSLYLGLPSASVPSSDKLATGSSPLVTVPIPNCGVLPVKPIAPDISTRNLKPVSVRM